MGCTRTWVGHRYHRSTCSRGAYIDAPVQHSPRAAAFLREHFTVDGTLIEAWASLKSFKPQAKNKDKAPGDGGSSQPRDFRGESARSWRIRTDCVSTLPWERPLTVSPSNVSRRSAAGDRWKTCQAESIRASADKLSKN
jgi:hypothetical protein